MVQFHFIEDYDRHVRKLKARYPIDEAMSLAADENYDEVGRIELEILKFAGLCNGTNLLDLGCGSGRLIERSTIKTWCEHLGLDFVQYIPGPENPWRTSPPLGQSIAILKK